MSSLIRSMISSSYSSGVMQPSVSHRVPAADIILCRLTWSQVVNRIIEVVWWWCGLCSLPQWINFIIPLCHRWYWLFNLLILVPLRGDVNHSLYSCWFTSLIQPMIHFSRGYYFWKSRFDSVSIIRAVVVGLMGMREMRDWFSLLKPYGSLSLQQTHDIRLSLPNFMISPPDKELII